VLARVAMLLVLVSASAHAEPAPPQVLHVPTAWLQPRDTVHGSAGANHRGGGFLRLTGGLGGLADVDVEVTDRYGETWVGTAGLKVGASRRLASALVAAVVGFRRSFGAWQVGDADADAMRDVEIAEAFAVASARVRGLRGHAGVAIWASDVASATARPFAGLEWTPPPYPKTTLLVDFSWAPDDDGAVRWVGGWGVRYQALDWGSIELAVRHREGDDLDGATVLVRVAGVLALRKRE
jgi:hypothetical protein